MPIYSGTVILLQKKIHEVQLTIMEALIKKEIHKPFKLNVVQRAKLLDLQMSLQEIIKDCREDV